MKSLQEFLQNFFKTIWSICVFFHYWLQKICGLISGLLWVVRMLPKVILNDDDCGLFFAVFATFSGFGSSQRISKIRVPLQNKQKKRKTSSAFFLQGFLYQLILSVPVYLFRAFFRSEIRRCFGWFYFFLPFGWLVFIFQSYPVLF